MFFADSDDLYISSHAPKKRCWEDPRGLPLNTEYIYSVGNCNDRGCSSFSECSAKIVSAPEPEPEEGPGLQTSGIQCNSNSKKDSGEWCAGGNVTCKFSFLNSKNTSITESFRIKWTLYESTNYKKEKGTGTISVNQTLESKKTGTATEVFPQLLQGKWSIEASIDRQGSNEDLRYSPMAFDIEICY